MTQNGRSPRRRDHGTGQAGAARVRILLVQDHAAMREAFAAALGHHADLQVVGQAGSLDEARQMLAGVDVAVLDLRLPDGGGSELIDELRQHNPAAQAILFSASAEQAEVAEAVRLGAAAVHPRSARLDEVISSVRRLAEGQPVMPADDVIELLRLSGRRLEREHSARLALDRITAREREVLQALADGLDSHASAERLGISVRTQRNHVTNIEAKLGVHSQVQALVFALRYEVVRVRAAGREPANGW